MEKRKEEMKSLVWDCGSSLYDSFELKSLQRRHLRQNHVNAPSFSPPSTTTHRQGSHALSTSFSDHFSGLNTTTISPQQTDLSIRPPSRNCQSRSRRILMGFRRR
ncbi:hypothetical protein L1987_56203 [Smallanthus sonchifolius]|uniref:Uncharacterized protein n=1 Tax=Smallanthus sonchifolius TaxID=185202 RepID=A0ACB9EBH9_9ASTR|nr:hypothetical protein L1987_56203 [Smallanthus sonchifolius]